MERIRVLTLLSYWNWKAAFLSAVLRSLIFVVTGFRYGWRSVAGAVIAESLFRILTSGFYGAAAERLTRVRSRWKVLLVLVVVFPAAEQTLDYFIHRARGTPNLGWAMLVSCTVMVVSAAFNWYVMTHGALLTSGNAAPLTTDLRRLPLLVLRFAAEGPLMMWRALFSGRAE
jgi:hypothetical protein